MNEDDITSGVTTLLVQSKGGYYISPSDIEKAEKAVEALQGILAKAKVIRGQYEEELKAK